MPITKIRSPAIPSRRRFARLRPVYGIRMSLAIPFMVQVWLFVSPVAYPSSLVPKPWEAVYGINPMVGVIEGFRWALLGQSEPSGPMLAVSALMVAVLLVGGSYTSAAWSDHSRTLCER